MEFDEPRRVQTLSSKDFIWNWNSQKGNKCSKVSERLHLHSTDPYKMQWETYIAIVQKPAFHYGRTPLDFLCLKTKRLDMWTTLASAKKCILLVG